MKEGISELVEKTTVVFVTTLLALLITDSLVLAAGGDVEAVINTCLATPEKVGKELYPALKSCENLIYRECLDGSKYPYTLITTSEEARISLCRRFGFDAEGNNIQVRQETTTPVLQATVEPTGTAIIQAVVTPTVIIEGTSGIEDSATGTNQNQELNFVSRFVNFWKTLFAKLFGN